MLKEHNPFSLAGKAIIITGASSGIGRECSIRCSQLGARLVLVGRNTERLEETRALLEGNQDHLVCPFDLTDYDTLNEFIETLRSGLLGPGT